MGYSMGCPVLNCYNPDHSWNLALHKSEFVSGWINLKLGLMVTLAMTDIYVTSWDKTSHMLQNRKLHKFAFYLKMSKYIHFLFSTKTKYLYKFVSIKLIFSHFC